MYAFLHPLFWQCIYAAFFIHTGRPCFAVTPPLPLPILLRRPHLPIPGFLNLFTLFLFLLFVCLISPIATRDSDPPISILFICCFLYLSTILIFPLPPPSSRSPQWPRLLPSLVYFSSSSCFSSFTSSFSSFFISS